MITVAESIITWKNKLSNPLTAIYRICFYFIQINYYTKISNLYFWLVSLLISYIFSDVIYTFKAYNLYIIIFYIRNASIIRINSIQF